MRVNLDFPLHLSEITSALSIPDLLSLSSGDFINAICTDTRECQPHDLFIALDGENGSGENFVTDALHKRCLVISSQSIPDVINVNNTTEALLSIATLYKQKTNISKTIAVTGSVGKSTTVKFISKVLSEKYKVHHPFGNFNNHIGVPLTIFKIPTDAEVLVLEMGMNHKNEISALSKCSQPDIGIITAIGTSHIGNLGSRESIASAKLEILDGMKSGELLIPYNEPLLNNAPRSMSVGRNSSLSHFSLNDAGDKYIFRSQYKEINNIVFHDRRPHLLNDLAFALSTAHLLGLSENEIINGVGTITDVDLRQRFIELNDFTIFDDSYNASLESIAADLFYIRTLNRPYSAFLGDVLELGERSEDIHVKIGRIAAESKIRHLYLIGDYAEQIAYGATIAGMEKNCIFINNSMNNPEISVKQILKNHFKNEIILFKSSHKLRLDKIADMITDERK